MENEIKRIVADEVLEAMKKGEDIIANVEWNGLSVSVKKFLNLPEMLQFCDVCVKACFNENENSYMPEAKDFVIRSCMVLFYTNIDLPEDLVSRYDFLNYTKIADIIMENIDTDQFKIIMKSIDEKIKCLVDMNTSYFNSQINDACNAIEGIQEKMSTLFDGVSSEDIGGVLSALSSGKIDEEKIVKAITESKK